MTLQVFVGKCGDGIIHAFKSLDDGAPCPSALCGADVRAVGPPRGSDKFCSACVPLLETELNVPPGTIGASEEPSE